MGCRRGDGEEIPELHSVLIWDVRLRTGNLSQVDFALKRLALLAYAGRPRDDLYAKCPSGSNVLCCKLGRRIASIGSSTLKQRRLSFI